MVQQGIVAKEIREKLNMLYVKYALLVAKKMHEEGDCIYTATKEKRFVNSFVDL